MLNDPHGEPSLGQSYRFMVARLARAIQRAGANQRTHQAFIQLDEIRIKLDAWADLVGVKKDVLEAVEEDSGRLAVDTRESFSLLHDAMDHVEMKLGLKELPRDGSGVRPDALTHLRYLFQTRLMERTGNFSSYVSAARRSAMGAVHRAADSATTAAAAYGYSSNNPPSRRSRSGASTPRNAAASPGYAGRAPAEFLPANVAAETPASERTSLDTNDASLSRPSTAGSAYRLATSSAYATSPQSSYPSISQLLSSPHRQEPVALQTPPTASSNSSPMTPWSPYNPSPSPYSTSPVHNRSWSHVVLSPIQGDDTYQTPRPHYVTEAPRPVEPRMPAFYQPTAQTQAGFRSEGWLASDQQRSKSASGWRGAPP